MQNKAPINHLLVAARDSPLSQAQVKEISALLQHIDETLTIKPILTKTIGDMDLKTSLRTLSKTDFFTKEVDDLLINGTCRVAVHSAKDLPDAIPNELEIVAITKGVDSRDSLVLRNGESLHSLKPFATIATSSERREEMVRTLRQDLTFVDIRGTIGQRIERLMSGAVDGVVIAEAALIRLNLSHLNRVFLPGETTPGQGQLAVLARKNDHEMAELFAPIDTRKTILHLGIDLPDKSDSHSHNSLLNNGHPPSQSDLNTKIIHFPIISIHPRPFNPEIVCAMAKASYVIFTSKSAVRILCDHYDSKDLSLHDATSDGINCFENIATNHSINGSKNNSISPLTDHLALKNKTLIAVGQKTAEELRMRGYHNILTPKHDSESETAEGVIQLLSTLDLKNHYVFWPHSSLSRGVISEYLSENNINYYSTPIYDTKARGVSEDTDPTPLTPPSLDHVDLINFTSPSTIDAFLKVYGENIFQKLSLRPKKIQYNTIGPVTAKHLSDCLRN